MNTIPNEVFWLWLSGLVFFVMTAIFLAGPFRRDKSELMQGFLGFLGGIAWFHIWLGASMYWGSDFLAILASLGAVTGSAFLLKFPLLVIANEQTRKMIFYIALAIGWVLIAWLLLTSAPVMKAMMAGAIYMIVVSGGLSGFYIVWRGFHLQDPALKIKCIGGGCSVVLCCFFTHLIVLTIGMTIIAKTFMVLTPISMIGAVLIARKMEERKGISPIQV